MLMMEALKPRSLMLEEGKNTERSVEQHLLEEIGWFSRDGVSVTLDCAVEWSREAVVKKKKHDVKVQGVTVVAEAEEAEGVREMLERLCTDS
jgi:hypothetical protein